MVPALVGNADGRQSQRGVAPVSVRGPLPPGPPMIASAADIAAIHVKALPTHRSEGRPTIGAGDTMLRKTARTGSARQVIRASAGRARHTRPTPPRRLRRPPHRRAGGTGPAGATAGARAISLSTACPCRRASSTMSATRRASSARLRGTRRCVERCRPSTRRATPRDPERPPHPVDAPSPARRA